MGRDDVQAIRQAHSISEERYGEELSVKQLAALCTGYSNQGFFIALFRRYYGMTPGELLRLRRGR